jgi:hypothetical protein
MSRGGFRKGSGRKSTWASGCTFEQTKLIRVPIAIADRLLEIAHTLDNSNILDLETKSKNETVTKSELITKAKQIILDESLVRLRDRSSVRKYFSLLLDVDRNLFKD